MNPSGLSEAQRAFWTEIHASHPTFSRAVAADTVFTLRSRGEPHSFRSRYRLAWEALRLAWVTDAFLAQGLYRAKARMQALGVPVLPRLAHRIAISLAGVSIGDPVVVEPGLYLPHGQVVVDGLVRISSEVVLAPFVTIGLKAGVLVGPVIEDGVQVGTGAKIIGPLRVSAGARVGAGAVVVDDVPAGSTVVGVPARPL